MKYWSDSTVCVSKSFGTLPGLNNYVYANVVFVCNQISHLRGGFPYQSQKSTHAKKLTPSSLPERFKGQRHRKIGRVSHHGANQIALTTCHQYQMWVCFIKSLVLFFLLFFSFFLDFRKLYFS